MPARKGLLAPQNTFLDTIATRFDGTHGFCELTGYSRAQIMQKSCACNFLYGQKTDAQHRESISRALGQKQELKLEVILYKSSGTPFWCLLDIVPIQDEKHEVVLFLCSHKDITKQKLHEQHTQHQQQLKQRLQLQQQLLLHQQASAHHSTTTGDAIGDQGQESHSVHSSNETGGHLQSEHHQSLGPKHSASFEPAAIATDASHSMLQHAHESSPAHTLDSGEIVHSSTEPLANQSMQLLQQQCDAAAGNGHALIGMDEFGLSDEMNPEGDDLEFEEGDESDDQDKHTASQYSRRRSRAVLYQLSGHYGYRRSVNMKSKLKLNNRMNIPEYKTTTIEKQRFILLHYGLGKSCWDWLILIVTFYVAIVVPYNATFKAKQELGNSVECKVELMDIIVEVIFLIDVLLNLRTTYVNRKGEVVTRPKFQSRIDLNLVKLIRLLRLARLLQKMDRYSQYSYIILTMLMLIFSLLAHWCACIWYVIAMTEIENNPPDWKIGWLHQLADKLGYSSVNATDMASSYVTALYFTTSSLTSVGFGNVSANTNLEKVFSIVIMLIGALMHAVVFGNVTALIRVMYARRSNYQTRLRDLKDFFRLHQVPKELQQRMNDYFQTTWSLNHGIDTYEILKDFPEELRGDVSLHLHREVLSLPIFETAPQGFLKSLARHIESKFCCPTEFLIHRGDALNYLYLVCNGSMEVLQDNMVVAILGKGDLVGYDVSASVTPEHTQFGLATSKPATLVKSSSDLKALTYCDLKCIHISGLLEVLKLYPEFSDTFHDEIIHDLSFNLRETNHDERNELEHNQTSDDEGEEDEEEDDGEGEDDGDDNDEDDDGGDDNDEVDDEEGNEDEDEEERESEVVQKKQAGTDQEEGSESCGAVRAGRGNCQSEPTNGRSRFSSPPPPPHVGHLYKSMGAVQVKRANSAEEKDNQLVNPTSERSEDGEGRGGQEVELDEDLDEDDEEEELEENELSSMVNEKRPGLSGPTGTTGTEMNSPETSEAKLKSALNSSSTGNSSGFTSNRNSTNRKLEISFDLSKNKTTIFERRRQSVGCFGRQGTLTQQAQQQQQQQQPSNIRSNVNSRAGLTSASLIHIGPELEANGNCKKNGASAGMGPLVGVNGRQRQSKLKKIDEQINAISASLGEVNEKLNQFQFTLRSIHALFLRDQANKGSNQSKGNKTRSTRVARSQSSASLMVNSTSMAQKRAETRQRSPSIVNELDESNCPIYSAENGTLRHRRVQTSQDRRDEQANECFASSSTLSEVTRTIKASSGRQSRPNPSSSSVHGGAQSECKLLDNTSRHSSSLLSLRSADQKQATAKTVTVRSCDLEGSQSNGSLV